MVRAGATPVLVDCDADTWNATADRIADRITPRTKAIMVVHIYGLPVDMDPVLELARRHGLKIIEDAAEMHGQTYKGRPCGSLGDISTFSFYPNKLVTTGEGGMVLTDDSGVAERCRALRNLCFQPGKRFVHEDLGWNFRISNLQAAVGVAQLERLDEFVARKRRIGAAYQERLRDIPGLQLPVARTAYAENIYWVFGVVLDEDVPFDAAEAMKRLAARGIGTRPFFWPMHEQPVLRRMGLFAGETYPNAERLARRGFYLPSGLPLTGAADRRGRSNGAGGDAVTVFGESARYYDSLYADKDYAAEVAYVDGLIQRYAPGARSVLDLGCGTGRHAIEFAERGYSVLGIDRSRNMLNQAQAHKGATFAAPPRSGAL